MITLDAPADAHVQRTPTPMPMLAPVPAVAATRGRPGPEPSIHVLAPDGAFSGRAAGGRGSKAGVTVQAPRDAYVKRLSVAQSFDSNVARAFRSAALELQKLRAENAQLRVAVAAASAHASPASDAGAEPGRGRVLTAGGRAFPVTPDQVDRMRAGLGARGGVLAGVLDALAGGAAALDVDAAVADGRAPGDALDADAFGEVLRCAEDPSGYALPSRAAPGSALRERVERELDFFGAAPPQRAARTLEEHLEPYLDITSNLALMALVHKEYRRLSGGGARGAGGAGVLDLFMETDAWREFLRQSMCTSRLSVDAFGRLVREAVRSHPEAWEKLPLGNLMA